jgi:hypothetical protein
LSYLQPTTNLATPANWSVLAPAPVAINGQDVAINPSCEACLFYRLSTRPEAVIWYTKQREGFANWKTLDFSGRIRQADRMVLPRLPEPTAVWCCEFNFAVHAGLSRVPEFWMLAAL